MSRCTNRPEGFGPQSTLHPSLPTTCFIDTIVVPLPTYIYLAFTLLFLAPLTVITRLHSRRHIPKTAFFNPASSTPVVPRSTRRWVRITLRVLYYFLLVAMIAMVSLELARLQVAELGLGLLPFLFPAIVVAGVVRTGVIFSGRRVVKGGVGLGRMVERAGMLGNTLLWVLLTVVLAVKVATYVVEGVHSRDQMVPVDAYSVVDEVTDVGVMIILVIILAVLEGLGFRGFV